MSKINNDKRNNKAREDKLRAARADALTIKRQQESGRSPHSSGNPFLFTNAYKVLDGNVNDPANLKAVRECVTLHQLLGYVMTSAVNCIGPEELIKMLEDKEMFSSIVKQTINVSILPDCILKAIDLLCDESSVLPNAIASMDGQIVSVSTFVDDIGSLHFHFLLNTHSISENW